MASRRRMPPYRRSLRDNIYMNEKHITIDSRRRLEDMAKKSGKKKDEKTVDGFIPIVDLGDKEDEIDFAAVLDDDTEEADKVTDKATDPKHPCITSDDLDAYVHDGGIDCYEKTPIMTSLKRLPQAISIPTIPMTCTSIGMTTVTLPMISMRLPRPFPRLPLPPARYCSITGRRAYWTNLPKMSIATKSAMTMMIPPTVQAAPASAVMAIGMRC